MGFPSNYVGLPIKYVPVTKSDSVDFAEGPAIGLRCDTEGTLNLVELDGTVRTAVFVHKGDNPLPCKRVNTGGTTMNIWSLHAK